MKKPRRLQSLRGFLFINLKKNSRRHPKSTGKRLGLPDVDVAFGLQNSDDDGLAADFDG